MSKHQKQMVFDFFETTEWEMLEQAFAPDLALVNCAGRSTVVEVRNDYKIGGRKGDGLVSWVEYFGRDREDGADDDFITERFRELRPSVAKVWQLLINEISCAVRIRGEETQQNGEISVEMDVASLSKLIGLHPKKTAAALKAAFTSFGRVSVRTDTRGEFSILHLGSVEINKVDASRGGAKFSRLVARVVVNSLDQKLYRDRLYPVYMPKAAWRIDGKKYPYAFVLTRYICGLVQTNSYHPGKKNGFQILPKDDVNPARAVQRVSVKSLLEHTRIKYETEPTIGADGKPVEDEETLRQMANRKREFTKLVIAPLFRNLDAVEGFFWRFTDNERFYPYDEAPSREAFLSGFIEFEAEDYPVDMLRGAIIRRRAIKRACAKKSQ